jgi:BASS family bile acid:Na+ symporter
VGLSLDSAYTLALVVALWSMGLGLGMSHRPAEVLAPLRRRSLFARVAAVDVVVLPLLVWALVRALGVPDAYAVGLLLVGVASGGPLGIKATQLARGDVPSAVMLVGVLEVANLLAIPVWAALLMPAGMEVSPVAVLRPLVLLVLLPVGAGLVVRAALPARAAAWAPRASAVSTAALVAVVLVVLARDGSTVVDGLGELVPLVAATAVVSALALGWLAGGPARPTRISSALVTGIRANGPALAIAESSFPGQAEVRVAVVTFAVFSVLVPLAAAVALGRAEGTGARELATAVDAAG